MQPLSDTHPDGYYELWDLADQRLIGEYVTEAESLAAVCRQLDMAGGRSVASWLLGHVESDHRCEALAHGVDLARRARAYQRTPARPH